MSKQKDANDLEKYLSASSENAAMFFKAIDYKHEVFQGCKIDFSPFICGEIYKDLLGSLDVNDGPNMAQKHGLFAAIVPIRQPNGMISISAEFGVVFPFSKSDEQKTIPPEKSS